VYLKAEALGPFATASLHKAFLETHFEMSIRKSSDPWKKTNHAGVAAPAAEGLKEWVPG